MTCSRNFRRVLQAGCLGLIGALTVVGCGGSENKPTVPDGSTGGIDGGPGKLANLTANPTTVPLGSVDVGKTSTPATVKITNSGTAASTVTVTPTGVGISASGCAGSLAIGASCDITIIATPTAPGAIVGSVAVAAANGNTIGISVTGTAVVPGAFTVAPNTIPLGDLVVGATVPVSVTVTATAAITAGLTTGVQGGDLVVNTTGSTCTGALAAGASCVVAATFTATAAGSPTNDAIVVSQGGVSKSVPVTANVLTPAKLAATPAKADLTATPGSPSTSLDINIGNIGGMTTGQLAVAITGTSFKIVSEACSVVTLAAGKFCTVTVAYQPAASVTLAEAGSLTVTDKAAGGSVATVALTGTPNISGLKVAGGPALGSIAAGATGAEVVFTVTNTVATPTGALTASVGSTLVAISSNTCATVATLNKGDTCTIGLKLAPPAGTAAQAIAGLLTVTSAAGAASASFTGSVITVQSLSATPPSVSFGSVPVNQISAAQSVTIKNVGATATGTLTVTLAGAGAAQVAITANTCTGTLDPAATCTVSVQYSPTDTTGVNGTISITDGVASASVPMSGTGLTPTGLVVSASTSGSPVSSDIAFGKAVVGYAKTPAAYYVVATATAASDSGAITAAITGANAADFAISTNGCTNALQPSASCPLTLAFTPGGVGARVATLTVTGSKGGVWTVQLTGTGLALASLAALDAAPTATPPTTGLDFGQSPNGAPGQYRHYLITVRGATSAAATTTTSAVTLANAGTPPDFRNVTVSGTTVTASATNRCDAAALGLTAATGLPTGTATNWSTVVADSTAAPDTNGFWSCDFYVQFYPQSGKSATPKTAAINASATAGGTGSLALTGLATGPLVFDPSTNAFAGLAPGQTSAAATLSLVNKGAAGVTQKAVSVVLGGANAADFGITTDGCSSAAALNPTTQTGAPYTAGTFCNILVAFSPATAGAKTATLTVTAASGETASATLTGTATAVASVTVTPAGATVATAVALGSVAQADVGAWTSFTVANPAGAPLTGKLTYAVAVTGTTPAGDFQLYNLANAGVTAYPTGFCGDDNTKQLADGESCIIQVRFMPNASAAPGARTGTLTVLVGGSALPVVNLQGTATPQLTLSGAAVTLNASGSQMVDYGSVGAGVGSTKVVTVTNNGITTSGDVTLHVSALPAGFSFAAVPGCSDGTALAGKATCQMNLLYTGVPLSGTPPAAPASGGTIYVSNVATPTASTVVNAPLVLAAQSVQPATLAFYGFGDYPSPAADADAIELGSAPLSTSTGVLTLWFTNTGKVAATGIQTTWTAITPSGASEFAIVAESQGTCFSIGGTLAPGVICSVNVRCTPAGNPGTRAATLNLAAAGITGVPVKLHATGIASSSSVYAYNVGGTNSLYTFGSTGATPAKAYFVLVNNTPAAIDLGTSTTAFTGGTPVIAKSTIGSPTEFTLSKEAGGTGTACGISLAAAGTCTFAVTFAPAWDATAGTGRLYRWAAVSASGSNILGLIGQVQKPATLAVTATTAGGVTVTGSTVDFGQILGGQTPSLTFTITNIGEVATAGAVALALGGTGSYATLGASTCGTTALAPAATCTVVVSSQLGGTLGLLNTMTVQATGATVSTAAFSLVARQANPASLSAPAPAATAFAATAAGVASAPITITVTNGVTGDSHDNRQDTGALAVTLSDPTNFVVDPSSTCLNSTTGAYYALPLSSGDEFCTVVVKFVPASAGAKSTTVSVSATVGGSPAPVTLTGTGTSTLAITPTTFSSPLVYTVTHSGSGTTGVLKSALSGANASVFAITADTCFGTTKTTTGSCSVTVAFIGTSSATAAQVATLTVTDGSANNTATVNMSVGGP